MAHNTRIRPSGNWVIGTLLPAELEALDQAQFEAINGDDGGTWAPTTVIVIGGAGLDVTGPYDFSGAGELSNVTFLDVNGQANFSDEVHFDGGNTVFIEAGTDVQVESGALIQILNGGNITWQTGSQLLVQTGATTIIGAGTTNIWPADITLSGKITRSSATGCTVWREAILAADSSSNVSVAADTYYYTHTIAGAVQLTLLKTTAPTPVGGERIYLHITNSGGGNVTIKSEGSGGTVTVVNGNCRLCCEYDGTALKWRLLMQAVLTGASTPGADA